MSFEVVSLICGTGLVLATLRGGDRFFFSGFPMFSAARTLAGVEAWTLEWVDFEGQTHPVREAVVGEAKSWKSSLRNIASGGADAAFRSALARRLPLARRVRLIRWTLSPNGRHPVCELMRELDV